jgi:hypothetical protein
VFKVSPKRQEFVQHLRGTIQNIVGMLAMVGLLLGLATSDATAEPQQANNVCELSSPKGGIQHVIYIQFDNTDFRRTTRTCPRISSKCRTCSISFKVTAY